MQQVSVNLQFFNNNEGVSDCAQIAVFHVHFFLLQYMYSMLTFLNLLSNLLLIASAQ